MRINYLLGASLLIATMPFISCGDDEENEPKSQENEQTDGGSGADDNSGNFTDLSGKDSNGREYVDLGLPSGTLWAKYNVGATKSEEFGNYFAWGETSPKDTYKWGNYKYATLRSSGELDSLTKYNFGNYGYWGPKDKLSVLLPEDDAATANWGSEWRMPTDEDFKELVKYCPFDWIEVNGVRGMGFTGANGNAIFLPAAGYRDGSDIKSVGSYGNYWSSTLVEEREYLGSTMTTYDIAATWSRANRCVGNPVRAVRR